MKHLYFLFFSFFFTTFVFADHANWMSQIPNTRILNQLIIPGTHDSGTDGITVHSKFSLSPDDPLPQWIEALMNILPNPFVQKIVKNWSKTQPDTITQQLNQGIRYFDFRVDLFQDGHIYLNHALLSIRFKNALQQIQEFTAQHPSEIIFIDINHVFDVNNPAEETQLIQLIYQYLGNHAVPNTFHPDTTIGKIRASGQRIIILMDINQLVLSSTLAEFAATRIWHESTINSPWPNVATLADLKSALDAEMRFRAKTFMNDDQFFVLQDIDTENANTVINGIIDPAQNPHNIHQLAKPVNAEINDWINGYIDLYTQKPLNIVIQDWFTKKSPLVNLAIQYDDETITPNQKMISEGKLNELKLWYDTTKSK